MNNDTDRNKNNDLFRMINLVHVTQVNRELTKVVSKWERVGVGEEEKTEYDLRRENYFKRLYTAKAGKEQGAFYWFELQRYESNKWRMIHMEPFSKAYNHQYEILPTDIIERIAKTKVNPDRVVTRKNLRSGIMDKTVDLKFVRFSETHMFGTVNGNGTGEAGQTVRWEGDMEAFFLAFFDYRDKYPRRVMEFVKEFAGGLLPDLVEEGWKPLVEPEGAVWVPDPELNVVPPGGLRGPDEELGIVSLYRLIALSKNPLYDRLLWLKLGEIEDGLLKDDIRAFEEKKQYYYEKLPRW